MQTLATRFAAYRARAFAPVTAIQAARNDIERGRRTPTMPPARPRSVDHGDVFRRRDGQGNRRTFVLAIVPDDDATPPWERAEGHGPVSDWTTRSKRPGEVLLSDGRGGRSRFYDWAEATRQAKRDGWGISPESLDKLTAALGRKPTRGEVAAAAVREDFSNLQRWCNGHWQYVGLAVFELPRDKELNPESVANDAPFRYLPNQSVWGVESYSSDYHGTIADELISELL